MNETLDTAEATAAAARKYSTGEESVGELATENVADKLKEKITRKSEQVSGASLGRGPERS